MTEGDGSGAFVPESFTVPVELVTAGFRLEPLGPQHNAGDYEAWTSSMDHIRGTPGFADRTWPVAMPPEQNLADLRQHADDFARRQGFTYTVLAGERVVGCVYIYPVAGQQGVADVRSWVRADRADLDVPLYQAVASWLAETWPFAAVRYAPR